MPNVSDLLLKKVDSREVEEIRKRLGVSNKKIVLFVGRLVELKGLQYLIPAFAKLLKDRGDVELLIIGDGPYKKKLQEFYKKFNVENNVRFLGWIDHEKLAPYYLMCNVVVIPSIVIPSMFKGGNIGDAYSLVTHEAASFGKPIIVTDAVGSAHSLVCSGVNGFVVPQRDIDALYDAMRIILCNSELEKKMGEESKKIVSKGFMYEHMVNGFKEAIEYVKAIRCRPKNFSSVRCKR
jgi:glycosyltransferase involved in cell wall biosynthesis